MSHVFGLASFVIALAMNNGVSSQIKRSSNTDKFTNTLALPAARSLRENLPVDVIRSNPKTNTAPRIATYPDRK
jgi:hypothetical protein